MTPLIILLIVVTTVSGILAWSRYRGNQYEEISISNPPSQEQVSQIYIGGAVNNPGFYPLTDGDSIEAIIQAAGGTLTNPTPAGMKRYLTEHATDAVTPERGLLVEFKNPKSFADAIIKILSNPSLKENMERNTYAYTRRMTWPNVAESYMNLFNKYVKLF